ncbi:superoxide dismutase [Candidatus Microgenomates bacterium]|nr:superoxide dismutase [Candidatus Microgenomates bacterium]
MSFVLPNLPYDYNALEPYIDKETMTIHHDKHHGAYVEKLNAALEKYPEFANRSIEEILMDLQSLPEDIRVTVRNNGGGHFNHSLFWEIMSPAKNSTPVGEIKNLIDSTFVDFETFKEKFSTAGVGRFGSGWVWLVAKDHKLEILDTPNQDNPLMEAKGTPILGLDVWEHAYYLKYQNKRPDYIKEWWNLVDWEKVETNFNKIV